MPIRVVAASQDSLARQMLWRILIVASAASVAFATVFVALYLDQLKATRADASLNLNRMLATTWENAMLKRDVEGLREIVSSLGALRDIRDVLVLAPNGEVRFASNPVRLGMQLPGLVASTAGGMATSRFEHGIEDEEVLRSINPVPNRTECVPCHGPVSSSPINGVLVIDYDATPVRQQALASAALFAAAGGLVIVLTIMAVWWLLRRRVLNPLAHLDRAAGALAAGDLSARVEVAHLDEIGRSAQRFNTMADALQRELGRHAAHRKYLQDLIDGLPDGLRVIRKSDFIVVSANRAFGEQLGLSAMEGQPCYISSHGRSSPCPPTMVRCPVAELQAHGQVLKCHHRHRRASGEEFAVEVHAGLIDVETEGGRERYIVESVRDVSRVASISQEHRMTELGLLAAGIAHEIHNPLGSLRLGLEAMERRLRGRPERDDRIDDYLRTMDEEIDRCLQVTQRLLMLSRPPQARVQPVDVNPVLADTSCLLAYDAENRQIAHILEADTAAPRVWADDADLRMLMINLVQNAHHAMPSGGQVTLRSRINGDEVLIEVEDTGVGIPEDDVPHLFEPFFSRRADGEPGTGLGLSICRSIVDHYGGRIAVESRPGEGARFRVSLPRVLE